MPQVILDRLQRRNMTPNAFWQVMIEVSQRPRYVRTKNYIDSQIFPLFVFRPNNFPCAKTKT